MKIILLGLLMTTILGFSGCGALNKDAEVNSFITEMDKLTVEIVRAVDEKPTEGVDKAQKLLDARKTELKKSYEKFKDIRGFQLSKEMQAKFTDTVTKDLELVGNLQIRHAKTWVADQNFAQKLDKLTADYNSIFGV
jgi:hypothetical protein